MFLDANGQPRTKPDAIPGGLSVGVPGVVKMLALAHKKYGKLPWAKLFEPAIKLADEGFPVGPKLARTIKNFTRGANMPDLKAHFYHADGTPLAEGETYKNAEYAATLRKIAAEGPDGFYKGEIAQAIVDKVQHAPRQSGGMTLEDLANYQAKERAPVCGRYRVWRVCGMGPPSSGATTVFQILGMLERFDLKAMGKDNPQSWHLIAEAMRLGYADREKYLGDPGFVSVPVSGLLDKAYIASRSALISPDHSLAAYEAGTPPGAQPRTAALSSEVAGTTHFVAVDGNGDIASMTSTIEGPFGSQLVANGYFLNNELTDFTFAPEKDGAPVANRVEAGKRPLSSMSPTIVYGPDGKAVFAVGAAGGKTIIMQVAKTLIAHLDWGLPVQEAVAAPNIYFSGDAILVEPDTPLAAMQSQLAAFGRTVVAARMTSKANAAEWTGTGWQGAADPRSEGVALGE